MIRCAEEANLRGIYITTVKSDKFAFKTEGFNFHVYAPTLRLLDGKLLRVTLAKV